MVRGVRAAVTINAKNNGNKTSEGKSDILND
jgi:hypothetical protein